MSKASFCERTSTSKTLAFNVATGMMLFEKTKAIMLRNIEKNMSGRITRHIEMPDAFMAASS